MSWLVWSLLSALFAAATALLAKIGVSHVEPNLATAVRTTVILVLTWGIAFATGAHRGLFELDRRSLWFLVASGAATGLSWLCYFRALAIGPASRVAPIDKLSVIFVVVLAWPILGEPLSRGKVIGGLLIATGAMVLAVVK